MHQFKEGDIVMPRIFKDDEYPTIGYNDLMKSLIGEQCIILNNKDRCSEGAVPVTIINELGFPSGYHWCWPDEKLILIKSKENDTV